MKGSFQEAKFGKELNDELEKTIRENIYIKIEGEEWTEKDIYILKRLYGKVTIRHIMPHLPNRTYNAIAKQASRLCLTDEKYHNINKNRKLKYNYTYNEFMDKKKNKETLK